MLRRTPFKHPARAPRVYAMPKATNAFRSAAPIGDTLHAMPKAPEPWRSTEYRRAVASLECYICRIHGHSQAAHPNTGKGRGKKLGDDLVFPLCTVSGNDCHRRFDHYEIVAKGEAMQQFEQAAHRWTVGTLRERGLWIKVAP